MKFINYTKRVLWFLENGTEIQIYETKPKDERAVKMEFGETIEAYLKRAKESRADE